MMNFDFGDTGQADEDQGILDEVQELGRVKMTCVVRLLGARALDYLTLMRLAQEIGDAETVAHAKLQRQRISAIQDYLYGAIDAYFGGQAGREASIGSKACHNIEGLEAVFSTTAAVIALIISAGGVLGILAWLGRDLVGQFAAYGYCSATDDLARCKAALQAAGKQATSLDVGLLGVAGVLAAAGGLGYLWWWRQRRQGQLAEGDHQ